MKKVRILSVLIVILSLCFTVSISSANWYAGIAPTISANGVRANISTPLYLFIAPGAQSGEDNWVSTTHSDANGQDWIQTGWRYYYGGSNPTAFWETCIDCTGQSGTHNWNLYWADLSWSQTHNYNIERISYDYWCASFDITNLVHCQADLNGIDGPQTVEVLSEIHESDQNRLNTLFDTVQYNDTSGYWTDFPDSANLLSQSPYLVWQIIPNSKFKTIRSGTYLPLIKK